MLLRYTGAMIMLRTARKMTGAVHGGEVKVN